MLAKSLVSLAKFLWPCWEGFWWHHAFITFINGHQVSDKNKDKNGRRNQTFWALYAIWGEAQSLKLAVAACCLIHIAAFILVFFLLSNLHHRSKCSLKAINIILIFYSYSETLWKSFSKLLNCQYWCQYWKQLMSTHRNSLLSFSLPAGCKKALLNIRRIKEMWD